jgi:signal transduction histidine kinase
MPPDVSMSRAGHDREPTVEDLKRELVEAREQQAATSEILGIISRSSSDLESVLDTIVATATRLCGAEKATIRRRSGDAYLMVAEHGCSPEQRAYMEKNPVAAGPGTVVGRAGETRKPVYVADVEADQRFRQMDLALGAGFRAALAVPLMREGEIIGVLMLLHSKPDPFTADHIERAQTFANQAVIAIENTRLFEAEQESKRELTEALEQQTATADVLKVISRSALDVQRVLDALVESAARLCDAYDAVIFQVFGDGMRLVAHHGQIPLAGPVGQHTVPLVPGLIAGRAIIDRRTIHVADVLTQADEYPESGSHALKFGYRTALGAPLVHAGEAIGVILIRRTEVRPFTERQLELVNTFADQAVIAIENSRLFEQVQARTRDLTEALEQQTATSEVLNVISRSPTDAQPVFDAISKSAARLCAAELSAVYRFDGKLIHVAALTLQSRQQRDAFEQLYPRAPDSRTPVARAILERRTQHVPDTTEDPAYAEVPATGFRSALAVPMLRDGSPIGAVAVGRTQERAFSDGQVMLLQTLADQAVIAIQNTRLFDEVQARNRDLMALGEVGRAVSSTLDVKTVLKTIVDRAVELSGTDGGSIFYIRDGRFELGETVGLDENVVTEYRKLDIAAGQTGLGEAIAKREPLQIPDILDRPSNPLRDAAIAAGFRAALIVPLLSSDGPLGGLLLQRRTPGEFPVTAVSLMQSFADQSAIALENARLFEEIAQKSRELEIASQHKSQFVAHMSHELRTPLAAILGYAELMQEGFYEPLGQKSLDALTRIRSNGKHLLGLINTVLDIAKIESGQFTLNMAEYDIDSVVETVRSATESLAQNKKLALKTEVAKSLPVGLGDEQRLTQVLLNLVGNAIKFTDTGEVRVTAKAVNGHFNVSVTDTGPGIPVEHQARIFDQFHQVDSSNTKAKGGTGLGLAIAKQIVEMHGGRIWVESNLGKGSTFQMELPTRAEFRKRS